MFKDLHLDHKKRGVGGGKRKAENKRENRSNIGYHMIFVVKK